MTVYAYGIIYHYYRCSDAPNDCGNCNDRPQIQSLSNALTSITFPQYSLSMVTFDSDDTTLTALVDWGDGSPPTLVTGLIQPIGSPTNVVDFASHNYTELECTAPVIARVCLMDAYPVDEYQCSDVLPHLQQQERRRNIANNAILETEISPGDL